MNEPGAPAPGSFRSVAVLLRAAGLPSRTREKTRKPSAGTAAPTTRPMPAPIAELSAPPWVPPTIAPATTSSSGKRHPERDHGPGLTGLIPGPGRACPGGGTSAGTADHEQPEAALPADTAHAGSSAMFVLRFLALVLTAISLVPSAAHLFELPGKIGLDERRISRSRASMPAGRSSRFRSSRRSSSTRRSPSPSAGAISRRPRWSLASAVLIALSLVTFFTWVFPGNRATKNWTSPTGNWMALRTHWEYGHAAGAAIVFLAFLATCIATVRRRP